MHISIQLSDQERKLAKSYALSHGISLSDAFKRALFERIQDENDIKLAEKAYDEYLKSGQSRPIKEFWQELDGKQ